MIQSEYSSVSTDTISADDYKKEAINVNEGWECLPIYAHYDKMKSIRGPNSRERSRLRMRWPDGENVLGSVSAQRKDQGLS